MSRKEEMVFGAQWLQHEQRGEEHCRDAASSGSIAMWMPQTKQILVPGSVLPTPQQGKQLNTKISQLAYLVTRI